LTEASPWDDGMSAALAARMERVANDVALDWGLRLGPRIVEGRYSYVAPAGDDAILKVVPPEDDDADQIADALRLWDGHGAVRLRRHDVARRALLLERVRPGIEAAALPEEDARRVAIDVGRKIWRSPSAGHPFRTIQQWVERWMPANDRHPLIPIARRTYERIEPRADVVVHADFHHHNMLKRDDEWVVIDPKPFVGEPEFDVISFLANPRGLLPSRALIERRITAFTDAGLDGDRIRQWSIVRGILDGLPDHGEAETTRMQIARMLL
jgi:streptomycin 6-kinase